MLVVSVNFIIFVICYTSFSLKKYSLLYQILYFTFFLKKALPRNYASAKIHITRMCPCYYIIMIDMIHSSSFIESQLQKGQCVRCFMV